jgi:hypothetical protein
VSSATCSVNKKLPDGTLISIGGKDATDMLTNLELLLPDEASEAIKAEIVSAFTPASAGGPVATVKQAFPEAEEVPPWERPEVPKPQGPTCEHGNRVYKEGVSAKGNPYKLWACPSQNRNNQCPAKWVK